MRACSQDLFSQLQLTLAHLYLAYWFLLLIKKDLCSKTSYLLHVHEVNYIQ